MYELSLVRPAVAVNVCWMENADRSLPLPTYATDGAAAMDVRANFSTLAERGEGVSIAPGGRALIPTGLRMEIPVGYELQVRPRSGLALKSGVTLANSPGTIDSDYRGEVGIIVLNVGQDTFQINHGDRVAQLVFAPVSRLQWVEVDAIGETERGEQGFGSTGVE